MACGIFWFIHKSTLKWLANTAHCSRRFCGDSYDFHLNKRTFCYSLSLIDTARHWFSIYTIAESFYSLVRSFPGKILWTSGSDAYYVSGSSNSCLLGEKKRKKKRNWVVSMSRDSYHDWINKEKLTFNNEKSTETDIMLLKTLFDCQVICTAETPQGFDDDYPFTIVKDLSQ